MALGAKSPLKLGTAYNRLYDLSNTMCLFCVKSQRTLHTIAQKNYSNNTMPISRSNPTPFIFAT
jgi:hypothetical protein